MHKKTARLPHSFPQDFIALTASPLQQKFDRQPRFKNGRVQQVLLLCFPRCSVCILWQCCTLARQLQALYSPCTESRQWCEGRVVPPDLQLPGSDFRDYDGYRFGTHQLHPPRPLSRGSISHPRLVNPASRTRPSPSSLSS